MACRACRIRKIKCDRTRPVCQNCKHRASHCTYAGERRTRTGVGVDVNRKHLPLATVLSAQILNSNVVDTQRAQKGVTEKPIGQSSTPAAKEPRLQPLASEFASLGDAWQSQSQSQQGEEATTRWNASPLLCPWMDIGPTAGAFSPMVHDNAAVLPTSTSANISPEDHLLDRILDGHDIECLKDTNPSVWMRVSDGDEYAGPSSGISAISNIALDWVRQNVADSDTLCEAIQDLQHAVINDIRYPKCLGQDPRPTPPLSCDLDKIPQAETLRYVDAYFSHVQVLFPILDRNQFLTQLSTFGTSQESQRYSWMALLNAVLASGCRAALSDETAEAFKTSGRKSWGYFQNALSIISLFMHGTTDLLAVQAMAVMTVFAQGLSSPLKLEYILSSGASRLAHSLGLNRHPGSGWNLTEEEKRERNRVFWVIYCLDKMIALRCGRPSVICDDEISCCFPREVEIIQQGEKPVDIAIESSSFDFFLCLTRLSRICGNVSRRLYSASALYTPSSHLLGTLNSLLKNLESWLHTVPNDLQPGRPVTRMVNTCGLSRVQIIVLHSSYYYVLCAIYRRFTPIFTRDSKTLEQLIDQKSHISHIEAARRIILLTKHLDIESYTPAWLIFYYPFTALTTIFVFIVSNPPDESTQRDVALMETVVGFFGHLEYITAGETAFTKTTEFVRLARHITDRHGNGTCTGRKTTSPNSFDISRSSVESTELPLQDGMRMEDDGLNMNESSTDGLAHVQPLISSYIGDKSTTGHISPQAEASKAGQQSESGCTNQEMGDVSQDQSFDSNLCFLASSPGDMTHSHWLGDWVPAS